VYLTALTICIVGFGLTLFLTLVVRFHHGLTWDELRRARCYEVVPLRALLWLATGVAWLLFLTDALLCAARILQLLSGEKRTAVTIITAILTGTLAWPLYRLGRLTQRRLIELPPIDPPAVAVGNASFRRGIPEEVFSDLGSERFPNHVDPNRHADLWIRCVLALALVGLLVLLYHLNSRLPATHLSQPLLVISSPRVAAAVFDVGLLLALASATLLAVLLYDNRDYTFLPFRAALVVKLVLGSALLLGVVLLQAKPAALLGAAGAAGLACLVRLGADLRSTWRYGRMKKVYNPIAQTLREHSPYLPTLVQQPGYQLPALHLDALHQRICQGCKNVEERGLFVTRHFGRFLDVLEVEHHDCAMVLLRYLTWRRYMSLGGGAGTYEPLHYPQVPYWDLDRFPLHPPEGYVEWLDPLGLGSEWDAVLSCGGCGGRGYVEHTVSETHNNQTTTRTERRTCGSCGGSGRLKHQQILNTHWQRLLPLVTHPDMRVPELVEDAEDVVYLHMPLAEDGESVPTTVRLTVPPGPVTDQLLSTAKVAVEMHPKHAKQIEELHGGTLHRADFLVCGYRTIRIRFEHLFGRQGWFFGRRPEFYFPRLPLSWSALGTCVFLPPLALVLGVGLLAAATRLFEITR
jgi:hypothetical protein